MFANIYPINHPNVGKYTIPGAFGFVWECRVFSETHSSGIPGNPAAFFEGTRYWPKFRCDDRGRLARFELNGGILNGTIIELLWIFMDFPQAMELITEGCTVYVVGERFVILHSYVFRMIGGWQFDFPYFLLQGWNMLWPFALGFPKHMKVASNSWIRVVVHKSGCLLVAGRWLSKCFGWISFCLLVQYHHLLYYFIAVGFQSIGQVSPKTLKEYPPVNYHSWHSYAKWCKMTHSLMMSVLKLFIEFYRYVYTIIIIFTYFYTYIIYTLYTLFPHSKLLNYRRVVIKPQIIPPQETAAWLAKVAAPFRPAARRRGPQWESLMGIYKSLGIYTPAKREA